MSLLSGVGLIVRTQEGATAVLKEKLAPQPVSCSGVLSLRMTLLSHVVTLVFCVDLLSAHRKELLTWSRTEFDFLSDALVHTLGYYVDFGCSL